MRAIQLFRRSLLLCIAIACVPFARSATVPDERDRQVLESLLVHLLADAKFDVTRVPATNGTSILLHVRTPEKTGFLMAGQIHSDIEKRTLPDDTENNLRQRNTPADAKPDSYEAVAASFTNLTFASGIVVTDLTKTLERAPGRLGTFEKAYPQARGWLKAYLPGYSSDGTHAVVRASVGPWAHAAMLTAVLEKSGDKWVVKWYHVARYV